MKQIVAATLVLALLGNVTIARAQSDVPSPTPDEQATTDQNAAIIAKANADKAVADAQKAASDAQKAAADAKTAAATASNGTVSGSTFATGAVTISDTGPQSEAMLLVSQAIDAASVQMAQSNELKGFLANHVGKDVVVITDPAQVSTLHVEVFDTQIDRLRKSFAVAEKEYIDLKQVPLPKTAQAKVDKATDRMGLLAAASGIDAGLSAISKLGSYFLTDYKYGSVAVQVVPQMYMASLIRRLGPASRVFISPDSIQPDRTELVKRLEGLDSAIQSATADHAAALATATALTTQAGSDSAHAATFKDAAAGYSASAAKLQALLDAASSLMTSVFTSTTDKAAPISQIIQEDNVRAELKIGSLVLLVTGTPTAAYYTEKSLWTFFGGIPIYTMGGTTMTAKLYDPANGQVFYWGTIAIHGGYQSVRAVERSISNYNKGISAQK